MALVIVHPVPATERRTDRAIRDGHRITRELGEELRRARVAAGLSQAEVARASGISQTTESRIERAKTSDVGVVLVVRLLAVVGLRLHARAYPFGSPRRDRAHAGLLAKLRARLHAAFDWRTEVPFPDPGDLRAWDAVARLRNLGIRIGIEAETRPQDGQELKRRLALKRRDGGVDRLILLLSDTRNNRRFLREVEKDFRPDFPISARDALKALAEGRDPGGDAIILL